VLYKIEMKKIPPSAKSNLLSILLLVLPHEHPQAKHTINPSFTPLIFQSLLLARSMCMATGEPRTEMVLAGVCDAAGRWTSSQKEVGMVRVSRCQTTEL
jgi:hypothetical protein